MPSSTLDPQLLTMVVHVMHAWGRAPLLTHDSADQLLGCSVAGWLHSGSPTLGSPLHAMSQTSAFELHSSEHSSEQEH